MLTPWPGKTEECLWRSDHGSPVVMVATRSSTVWATMMVATRSSTVWATMVAPTTVMVASASVAVIVVATRSSTVWATMVMVAPASTPPTIPGSGHPCFDRHLLGALHVLNLLVVLPLPP